MMSGAHSDTLTVEKISYFLRGNAVQHERKNPGFSLAVPMMRSPGTRRTWAVA
jgi:hypothetical protein